MLGYTWKVDIRANNTKVTLVHKCPYKGRGCLTKQCSIVSYPRAEGTGEGVVRSFVSYGYSLTSFQF